MSAITIADALRNAARRLTPHSESPRLDAQLLLGKVLGLSRSGLVAHDQTLVGVDDELAYADLLERRADGMPVAYLTGRCEFWSLPLRVTSEVLIPRPETETLVEHALALSDRDAPYSALDLGTGSGAIALALATERPQWCITAVDVSPQALKLAIENSVALELQGIRWREGSWFEPVRGERFDLIVANPPYIAAHDPALRGLRAEPAHALSPGPTGLEALSVIAAEAAAHLHARGWLALEHGSTQGTAVARLLAQKRFPRCPNPSRSLRQAPRDAGVRSFTTLGTSMIRFETSLGDFTIELFEKEAPESVANFTRYIDDKFFDGTIFHRIVPGFVIQGGGFTEDMSQKKTKPPVKNEADNGLKNKRGTLSMARTNDINSATSQFFVNLKDNDFLDHSRGNFGYAVFAKVTDGMDVVDKIAAVETGRKKGFDDVPVEAVTMKSVRRVTA